jgi:hypothetical protein
MALPTALIKKQVQAGIHRASNATVAYRSLVTSSLDNETGKPARSEITKTGIKAVLASFKLSELTASTSGVPGRDPIEIRLTDQKLIVATLDLPGVTPKASDRVQLADGSFWDVFLVQTDPAGAAWILGLRKP